MAQETADIQDVVRICAQHGVPVIAFGTGTSLEGQVNAPAGGVCIDLRDMNRVLEVHAEDLDCVIEPGVTRKALNEHLRDQGLFFPIDPGADASLGGMAATRASGTNAVRYGTMRDNVLALKVVRGDGEIITTGTRAKKSSAGYDLTHLFIGAEGTLGIISELTMKLRGIPETIAAAACSFESVRGACQATILAIQTGIPAGAHRTAQRRAGPRLQRLFEVDAAGDAAAAAGISRQRGRGRRAVEEFRRDRQGMRRRRLHLDHQAGGSHQTLAGAARRLLVGQGAAAGRRRGRDRRLRADFAARRLRHRDRRGSEAPQSAVADRRPCRRRQFPLFAGLRRRRPDEMARGEEFMHRLVERAQAMGGTCTGEHGIGQGKQKYLEAELGPEALDAMRALKQALDPQNIFNPGKILPAG